MRVRPEKKPESYALRHILTSAPGGFLRQPGLQTVARAGDLQQKGFLEEVEKLVESYSSPAADEPPCRQLMLIPGTEAAYALTLFTPLADSPDSRTGNFWAETLVVQGKWLEQGGWDAAAAFDALPWWGPRALAELERDLPLEPLPPLKPGDLQRLAQLVKLVPEETLGSLLLAVAQQSYGLRRLHLLEADRARAGDLQKVVTLLPLVVPPTCRTYRDGDQRRCLTLRTRSPRAMSLPADITGHPATESVEHLDGVVVDLGGRLPSPGLHDRFGRDYVEWLLRILQEENWGTLALLYERARGAPGPNFFATKSLLEALPRAGRRAEAKAPESAPEVPDVLEAAKGPAEAEPPRPETPVARAEVAARPVPAARDSAPPPAASPPAGSAEEPLVPLPVQARKEAWELRSEKEGAIWEVQKSHREQLEKLVKEVRGDFEAELEAADKSLRKQLAELKKDAERRSRQQSDSFANTAGDLSEQLKELTRKVTRLDKRLQELERDRGTARAEVTEPGEGAPVGEEPPERRPPVESPKPVWKWLRGHRRIAIGAGVTLVLALAIWLLWPREGRQEQPPPTGRSESPRQREALVQRVQDAGVAARLLAEVGERRELAESAHGLTLAIGLSRGIEIESKMDCALLQAALRRQTMAADQPGIDVDGECGEGTITALVNAAKNDCCLRFQTRSGPQELQRRRHCVLASDLKLNQLAADGQPEACSGESPWRKGRRWTADEAVRALTLFRDAAQAADESRKPELAKALRGLDPAQSPRLRETLEGKTLTPDEAKHVLELAWAAGNHQERRPLDQLSDPEIEGLKQFVDELAPLAQGAKGDR